VEEGGRKIAEWSRREPRGVVREEGDAILGTLKREKV